MWGGEKCYESEVLGCRGSRSNQITQTRRNLEEKAFVLCFSNKKNKKANIWGPNSLQRMQNQTLFPLMNACILNFHLSYRRVCLPRILKAPPCFHTGLCFCIKNLLFQIPCARSLCYPSPFAWHSESLLTQCWMKPLIKCVIFIRL